jgi:two-component system LytT family response regulator/two-component system response regulator AlgR
MSKALRVVLAEDEPYNLRRLSRLLKEAGVEVVGEFEDGVAAIEWFQAGGQADVAFLDIQMPGINGLEASADLPAQVAVVFVTAFAEHAVRAFEAEACDYLLKPVTGARLQKTLDRIQARRTGRSAAATPPPRQAAKVAVRAGEGVVFLDLGKVSHFTLENETVWAWSGERFKTLWHNLSEVEAAFPERGLLRGNRQLLLRPEAVLGVRTLENGRMQARIAGGQEVEVSRGAAPRLKERLGLPEKGRLGG